MAVCGPAALPRLTRALPCLPGALASLPRARFERRSKVIAGRGSAGCLIPPFEYHTLGNAAATPSVTLHVYGGEMDHCHVFEPQTDGSYRRVRKDLSYT